MDANAKMGWEILGFGMIVCGPVIGAVILSNKSPATWLQVWAVAATRLGL